MQNKIFLSSAENTIFPNFKSAWYRKTSLPILPLDLENEGLCNFALSETEAFLDGICYTNQWLWINKPSNVRIAANKLIQLAVAKNIGFQTPKTIVTNYPAQVKKFSLKESSVIVKSITAASISMDNSNYGIYTHALAHQEIVNDRNVQIAPFILQERIPRKSELRITIVGRKLFAVEILIKGEENDISDWHLADHHMIEYMKHELPPKLVTLCLEITEHFGLIYSALDFIITPTNDYVFLELNPSGQWGWIEHHMDYPITRMIAEILIAGRY